MELMRRTIPEQLKIAKEQTGQRISLTRGERSYTWEEIDRYSDRVSAAFLQMGVRRGERIILWSENSIEWIIVFFGILKCGTVAVLFNSHMKTYEAEKLILKVKARILCVGRNQTVPMGQTLPVCTMEDAGRFMRDDTEQTIEAMADGERIALSDRDPAVMLFTSGTVSTPKGVILTHFQMLNVAREAAACMHWGREDKVCLSLPLFHCFGLSTGLLAMLCCFGRIYMTEDFHSVTIFRTVERYQCTVLNGVPTMFLSMLKNKEREQFDITSLNSGIIAGSGVYRKDFLEIQRVLKIPHLMQSYGQTEASPSITFSGWEDSLELRSRSVGKVISQVSLRIVDRETGAVCPLGQDGEIEIFGYNVMAGYDPDTCDEEERRQVFAADGWLKTGDRGWLDEEGNLYISGRKKDMIIRGGENISPHEIEEVILQDEDVYQVRVFGIPAPVVQEDIVACIEGGGDLQRIRALLKEKLSDYKMPKYFLFYPDFPVNSSGKVDINQLKQSAREKILKGEDYGREERTDKKAAS